MKEYCFFCYSIFVLCIINFLLSSPFVGFGWVGFGRYCDLSLASLIFCMPLYYLFVSFLIEVVVFIQKKREKRERKTIQP